jgi:voltage-gated potassium channel
MKRPARELKDTGYELFIAAVAVLSIVNIVMIYVLGNTNLVGVLHFMNALCSLILLGDFGYRFRTASSRSNYFFRQFGWADLLASVPLPQLKVLRLFRLARVIRLMRELGVKRVWRALLDNTAGSALLTLLFVSLLVLEFGSLSMLHLEAGAPGANITNSSDALWYMIVTMATVGYGDTFPVTNQGRLLGSLVIIIGVGIFGTLTGYLANAFVRSRGAAAEGPPTDRRAELTELRKGQQALLDRIEEMIEREASD